jgi:hypothetical protein
VPVGQRDGGWAIHVPAVVCTLAQHDFSVSANQVALGHPSNVDSSRGLKRFLGQESMTDCQADTNGLRRRHWRSNQSLSFPGTVTNTLFCARLIRHPGSGRQTPGEPNDWFVRGADDTLRPATGRKW